MIVVAEDQLQCVRPRCQLDGRLCLAAAKVAVVVIRWHGFVRCRQVGVDTSWKQKINWIKSPPRHKADAQIA